MKTLKTILCIFSIVFFCQNVQAQRPVHTDEEIISETVIKEVDELFKSPEFVKKKISQRSLIG